MYDLFGGTFGVHVGILTVNKTLQVLQFFFASNNELGRGCVGGELSPGGVKSILLYWGCSKVSFLLQTFKNRYLNSLQ